MFNIDFVFKGKYDRLVQNYSGQFNKIDLSDFKTVDAKVDQIFKENKHVLGTWFEKSKKSALKATLIEAKTEHIANAVIHLRLNETKVSITNQLYTTTMNRGELEANLQRLDAPLKNSAPSLRKLSDRELRIITDNRDGLYDIFSKSKVIKLSISFNKCSSKLSHVAKHINKEFAKIGSNEERIKLNEESKKKFKKNYAIYLNNRQFNYLSREEIRKCDEYLVDDLKKNLFQGVTNADLKSIPTANTKLGERLDEETLNKIKILKHIKNDEPDLWKKFTHHEKKFLDLVVNSPLSKSS